MGCHGMQKKGTRSLCQNREVFHHQTFRSLSRFDTLDIMGRMSKPECMNEGLFSVANSLFPFFLMI